MIYYIYRITNLVNGKVYIGQTNDPKQRKMGHKSSQSNCHFRNSVKKYGWDVFFFKIIEITIYEKADEKEDFWINIYDSMNDKRGYNKQYSNFCNKIVTQETKQKMRTKVISYDKFTGEKIKEYDGITLAAKELKMDRHMISDCAKGRIKFVRNYIFKFYNEYKNVNKIKPTTFYNKKQTENPVDLFELIYNDVDTKAKLIRGFKSLTSVYKFLGMKYVKSNKLKKYGFFITRNGYLITKKNFNKWGDLKKSWVLVEKNETIVAKHFVKDIIPIIGGSIGYLTSMVAGKTKYKTFNNFKVYRKELKITLNP